ncbi:MULTISPECIES: ribonuclease T2 [unclassified Rhizobium]|uniref:ribonuclease T2 n=1 Tax=unclassified Rhizobium TaxID=2613769 RepID=UPI00071484B6|nr:MULTISPECIES: ribonuclease [unclassified Rhizobium]KQS98272.1 ribonuclease [Rhizobium sp. Leaf386]KQT00540.1 ribonuclease [Rhizobium sp. Leaf391]KQT97543.1 ribonuclease [Rhizobium sp. Leaf453]
MKYLALALLRRLGLVWIGAILASAAFAAEKASPPPAKTQYILAVSWQPGFCETRPNRKECAGQTADRFDATHFSLHGLWPMKKSYCGVAADIRARDKKGSWLDLPQLAMAEDTVARLLVAMPGTQSGLDRHQWLRSGTCQGGTAQDYFSLQLKFLDELNGSAVRTLFAGRIGKEVTESEIKQAFDTSFGIGAGERVRMRCQKAGARSVITGLTIGLSGDVSTGSGLSTLILAAGETDFKCGRGIVDTAGIQ